MSSVLPATGTAVDTETVPVPPEEGGGTAERQKITMADHSAALHYVLDVIAAALSMAVDPSTGRLRTVQEAATNANQSMNIAQINGVAPLMGAGATGTGSPRVTLANDAAIGLLETTRAGTMPLDMMATAYGQLIRPRIT
ncbi:MAG: hypothetical protein ACK53W_12660 [Gemmatimonadota bacterium]